METSSGARTLLLMICLLGAAGGLQPAALAQSEAASADAPVAATPDEAAGGLEVTAADNAAKKPAPEPPEPNPAAEWLRAQFPANLQQTRFLLADYQWLCLVALIFVGFLADQLTRYVLSRLSARAARYFDEADSDVPPGKLWRPVGLLANAVVWYLGTEAIGLPVAVSNFLLVALKLFAVVAAVWTGFLLIDLVATWAIRKAAGTKTKFDDLLIPLVTKSLKALAICVGLLTGADALDLPIAGLVGGLGLGGLALAMASKDAVSNLFGSVTVLVDRPFEVGDWIITSGAEGSVEDVGFRSTRIRTFYNSMITLPNSLLTTATIDNMGRRRYRRIKTTLGVQYDTTPEQMEAFCEGIRELIRRHPYTRKDYYHVYFNDFGDSSLNILLYCFLECPDWAIELRERQRLMLDILRLAARLGVEFAFPTRTVHLFQEEQSTTERPNLADPLQMGRNVGSELAATAAQQKPGPVEF